MIYNDLLGPRRGPAQTRHASTSTPQSQPIRGRASEMTLNRAGGYTFEVTPWEQLRRFLVLGTTQNTYYARKEETSAEALGLIDQLINEDPIRFVDEIISVSTSGAALKQSPAIFALARAASKMTGEHARDTNNHDPVTIGRTYALNAASSVLRTLTHVFEFLEYTRRQRGAGKGLLRALTKFVLDGDYERLEYQSLKYRQREGWTPRDLLRYSHPKGDSARITNLLGYIVNPESENGRAARDASSRIQAFENVRDAALSDDEVAAEIIRGQLTWEMVPNERLNSAVVWEAMLPQLPLNALVRNVRKLTQVGLLQPGSDSLRLAISKLVNAEAIRKARVHPLRLMMARRNYASGTDRRGGSYNVNTDVLEMLDDALDLSFSAVQPLNKRMIVAIDESGSMGVPVTDDGMSAREAACALAVWYKRSEADCQILAYSTECEPVNVTKRVTVESMNRAMPNRPRGTDCAQPFIWAQQNNYDADVVIQITDSHSWYGSEHTVEALAKYRRKVGHDVVAVAAATAPGGVTILDPKDPHSLNVIGFDATVPDAIAAFVNEALKKE